MRIRAFGEGWAWAPRDWTRATQDTGTGNPKAATAEKGKRYFEAVTQKIGGFLAELSGADLTSLYEANERNLPAGPLGFPPSALTELRNLVSNTEWQVLNQRRLR